MATRKIPLRYAQTLFSLLLSGAMTFVVSAVVTFRAVGFSELFLFKWITGWPIAWAVGFPAIFVLAPIVRRVVDLLVEKREPA